jgi:oligoribonuclease NrnB/cAMP/cGMP phosphodiesterase (DHH superfamily)
MCAQTVRGGVWVVTHTADLDGMASAAIAVEGEGEDAIERVFLADYGEEYVNALEVSVKPAPGDTVIIADIGCDKKNLSKWVSVVSGWKSRGARVLWLDHHTWDDDCVRAVGDVVDLLTHDTEGKCAAEVVLEHMGRAGDPTASRLAELAHDSDFNLKREPLAGMLSRLIAYYNYLGGRGDDLKLRLIHSLSLGILWTVEMDIQAREYEEILRQDYDRLLMSRVREVNGYRVVVGLRSAYGATEASNVLYQKFHYDIAFIVLLNQGWLSIRSERDDVNTKAIGEAFGGGGHLRHAAGGSIRDVFPNPTEEQLDAIADYIANKLSKIDFVLPTAPTPSS